MYSLTDINSYAIFNISHPYGHQGNLFLNRITCSLCSYFQTSHPTVTMSTTVSSPCAYNWWNTLYQWFLNWWSFYLIVSILLKKIWWGSRFMRYTVQSYITFNRPLIPYSSNTPVVITSTSLMASLKSFNQIKPYLIPPVIHIRFYWIFDHDIQWSRPLKSEYKSQTPHAKKYLMQPICHLKISQISILQSSLFQWRSTIIILNGCSDGSWCSQRITQLTDWVPDKSRKMVFRGLCSTAHLSGLLF